MKRMFFALYLTTLFLEADDGYVQVSSFATQVPTPGGSSYVLFDTVDLQKNFDISPSKNAVICRSPGVYMIFGSLQTASLSRGIGGYLDTWFELNGAPITESNARQYVDEHARVGLLTNAMLFELKENDILGLKFTASGPEIGIIFIQSPLTSEPSVSSYVFMAYKVY